MKHHLNLRMVVQMRDARLYAIRPDMHWLDAHDNQMLIDKRLGSRFLYEARS